MQTTKSIQAINGDLISVSHPALDLKHPMTTHATVHYNGANHKVVSVPSSATDGMAMVTGEYSVNGHRVQVVEAIDSNNIGKSAIRWEGVLDAEHGGWRVYSYDSAEHAVDLLAAMDPTDTELGVVVGANARTDFLTVPEVLLHVDDFAVLDIAPLTTEVNYQLPEWQGTPVNGGELFSANISRSIPFLILVTDSARVNIMPLDTNAIDGVVALAADLQVSWTP